MLILVTGGSGSGKSAFAEDRVLSLGEAKRIYIATMHPFDQESFKRIERHRKMRAGKGFDTIECYTGLKDVQISGDSVVLLECMSNLTANEMFEPEGAGDNTVEEVQAGVDALRERCAHLVIVTNDIFSDGITYDEVTALYQERLGEINRRIAAEADQAAEVICGIPLQLKNKGQSL